MEEAKKKSYLVANKNSEHCNTGWLTIKKMSNMCFSDLKKSGVRRLAPLLQMNKC